MIISQADPGLGPDRRDAGAAARPGDARETDGQPDGFQEFLLALRDEVIASWKPVVYVHGDSHYFRIDKPFLDSSGSAARELHPPRDVRRGPPGSIVVRSWRTMQARNLAAGFAAALLLSARFIFPVVHGIATWKIILGIAGLWIFVRAGMGR